jgi:hypothetical protein
VKKLLLATSILATLSVPAFSAEKKVQFPTSMLGPWCYSQDQSGKEGEFYERTASPEECKRKGLWLELSQTGLIMQLGDAGSRKSRM